MAFGSPSCVRKWLSASLVGAAFVAALAENSVARELRRLAAQERIEISRCEHFVSADAFRAGTLIGERTLGSVGFNFETLFLAAAETEVSVTVLQAWTLRYSADDLTLIERLGGEERVRVPLCSIYRLMEAAASGGPDKESNFAFARSPVNGRLMAIHWFVNHSGQWAIGAVEVPHALDWPAGSRVFGRAIVQAEER
jgi:hypothetical protein